MPELLVNGCVVAHSKVGFILEENPRGAHSRTILGNGVLRCCTNRLSAFFAGM
jgi:hypothetical protein